MTVLALTDGPEKCLKIASGAITHETKTFEELLKLEGWFKPGCREDRNLPFDLGFGIGTVGGYCSLSIPKGGIQLLLERKLFGFSPFVPILSGKVCGPFQRRGLLVGSGVPRTKISMVGAERTCYVNSLIRTVNAALRSSLVLEDPGSAPNFVNLRI